MFTPVKETGNYGRKETQSPHENTFEPQLIKKHQTRITQMDSQILSLYAKGMTTREIVAPSKRCTAPMCRPR